MENESKFNLKMAHFMCQFVSRYDFNGICSIVISLQVEQIQAEYKKLALELHPDKNSGDKEAEAKFQQIQVLWFDRLGWTHFDGVLMYLGVWLVRFTFYLRNHWCFFEGHLLDSFKTAFGQHNNPQ